MQIAVQFEPDVNQPLTPQQRLAVALLLATALHGCLLLFVRIDLRELAAPGVSPVLEITLLSQEQRVEPVETSIEEHSLRQTVPVPKPTAPDTREATPEPPAAGSGGTSQGAAVWQQRAARAAREIVSATAERERRNAEMWRQTHSVMFAPPPEYATEAEPYLPELSFDGRRFKGIGFRIGENCFFGIPPSSSEGIDTDASDTTTTGMRTGGIGLIHCNR